MQISSSKILEVKCLDIKNTGERGEECFLRVLFY